MKTNNTGYFSIKLGLTLAFFLSGGYLLAEQPDQVRSHEQDRIPISAKQLALQAQAGLLCRDAVIALHAGNYADAEKEARQARSLNPLAGIPDEILAEALYGQGKDQEALQEYRALAIGGQPRDLLPYALLLLKSGQWAKALAVYMQALPLLGNIGPTQANSRFLPDVPDSIGLAVAIHLKRGQIYNSSSDWAREPQNTEAMAEYQIALQLAPNNAWANYYYGYGWQELSLTDRAKMGSFDQAKAALKKAIKFGTPDVRYAAVKVLQNIMENQ